MLYWLESAKDAEMIKAAIPTIVMVVATRGAYGAFASEMITAKNIYKAFELLSLTVVSTEIISPTFHAKLQEALGPAYTLYNLLTLEFGLRGVYSFGIKPIRSAILTSNITTRANQLFNSIKLRRQEDLDILFKHVNPNFKKTFQNMLKSIEILTGKSFMFDGIALNLRPLLNQNISVPFNNIPDDLLMGMFKKHLNEVRNIAQIEQFNVSSLALKREILVEFATAFRGQENIFATLTTDAAKNALAADAYIVADGTLTNAGQLIMATNNSSSLKAWKYLYANGFERWRIQPNKLEIIKKILDENGGFTTPPAIWAPTFTRIDVLSLTNLEKELATGEYSLKTFFNDFGGGDNDFFNALNNDLDFLIDWKRLSGVDADLSPWKSEIKYFPSGFYKFSKSDKIGDWYVIPKNLQEKLFYKESFEADVSGLYNRFDSKTIGIAGPNQSTTTTTLLIDNMKGDPRLKFWNNPINKYSHNRKVYNGSGIVVNQIEIHFLKDLGTGKAFDFKIKE